jgi:hypothetical protein
VDIIRTRTSRPMWTRGLARIEGDEIILDGKKAHPYALFEEPEQHERLLMDLAELRQLGSIVNERPVNKRVKKPSLVKEFAWRHGLLWHQREDGSSDCRESWQSWLLAGYKLSLTIALYARLREAITTESLESVEKLEAFLRTTRDVGNASGIVPSGDEDLLEHASILLARRITEGLEGCTPTLLAACSLERGGKKVGPAGDFRVSINPSNLVAVAYNELVTLIEMKAEFRECLGCRKFWRFNPEIHHRNRRYCEDACYERTRKSEARAKKRSSL